MALKALTRYMQTGVLINGVGNFTLYVNEEKVQSISFDNTTIEAIKFDISDYIDEHTEIFGVNEEIEFTLAIEDAQPVLGEEEVNFKVSYSINAQYYDTVAP